MSDEETKRGWGRGLSVGAVLVMLGSLGGGFITAKAMGEADGELKQKVEAQGTRIDELAKIVADNREFRERVLAHIATQEARWLQIERMIYRGTAPVER